jgi:tRNA 2-thiocytidine biosynthesis protein TtcA
MKRLMIDLEREHPDVKLSVLRALSNVHPRHLLDRRLNPPAELAHAARAADPSVIALRPRM